MNPVTLVESQEFASIFRRWAAQVREALSSRDARAGPWALVGIKRGGAILARRLWRELASPELPLLYGEVDISLYRDDYHLQVSKPRVLGTEISFPVDGGRILLVDDVLYTGRTVRAAMDLILDFGRPRVILLAVFIDRGHRELPITANLVGKVIATEREDRVLVQVAEMGGRDAVELIRAQE
jgi:pyrimidine operon attenuation protein/uracil phosphoribosyltransferase